MPNGNDEFSQYKVKPGDDEWAQYKVPSREMQAPDAVAQARRVIRDIPQESMLGRVLTGPPLTAIESGLPSPAQIPANARAMQIGAAIGAPAGGLISGGIAAAPAIARTLAGSFGGAALGGYGGRRIGGLFGPRGAEMGERLGTIGGGILGGYSGFKTVPPEPPEPPPEYVPVSKSPGPYRGPLSAARAARASQPPPVPPFQGATSSGSVLGNAELPKIPPNLRQPDVQMVERFKPPEQSRIVEPGSKPPDYKVTYQSVPQAELRGKVMQGDAEAIREWQRRGLDLPPNVRFMVEGGANPKPWRSSQ